MGTWQAYSLLGGTSGWDPDFGGPRFSCGMAMLCPNKNDLELVLQFF